MAGRRKITASVEVSVARRQPKARYHFDFTRSDCTRPDMQAAHHLLLMHVRRRYHALVLMCRILEIIGIIRTLAA